MSDAQISENAERLHHRLSVSLTNPRRSKSLWVFDKAGYRWSTAWNIPRRISSSPTATTSRRMSRAISAPMWARCCAAAALWRGAVLRVSARRVSPDGSSPA